MSEESGKSLILSKIKSNSWCQDNLDMRNSRFLGKGTFGEVISGLQIKNQKEIAIKYLNVSDNQEFKVAIDEIIKMSALSHPNIIKIYDYFPEVVAEQGVVKYSILLAMELGSSSLDNFLKTNEALSDEQLTKVLKALGSALSYAHDRRIVHCDLKPANILIVEEGNKESWTAKISDWGGGHMFLDSKAIAATSCKPSMAFTLIYSAPEIRKHMGDIPEHIKIDYMQADIYSLGLILLNCCGIKINVTQNLSGHCDKEKKHDNEVEEVLDDVREKGMYSEKNICAIKNMLRFQPEKRKLNYDQNLVNQMKKMEDAYEEKLAIQSKELESLRMKLKIPSQIGFEEIKINQEIIPIDEEKNPVSKLKSLMRTIHDDHEKHFYYLMTLLKFNSLDQLNRKLHLLYRASEHNFDARYFHQLCDGKGKTLVLVRSKEHQRLFGGYSTVAWFSPPNNEKKFSFASGSFLFSLDSQTKHEIINGYNGDSEGSDPDTLIVKKGKYAIINRSNYGPTFGNDLHLTSSCHSSASSFSDLGRIYSLPPNIAPFTNESNSYLAGSFNFSVSEYEVFLVE